MLTFYQNQKCCQESQGFSQNYFQSPQQPSDFYNCQSFQLQQQHYGGFNSAYSFNNQGN
mgnify:CR=1 FL=1